MTILKFSEENSKNKREIKTTQTDLFPYNTIH
jgi:hypothetical protein